jgi:hypothetical protein
MKLADLSPESLEKIKKLRYDCIIRKHEGPEKWSDDLKFNEVDFLEVEGHAVLLPIPASHHPNVTVLRCIVGDQGQSLTLFLKDTTLVQDPRQQSFFAGFLAVCDRLPGEEFFVALVYHDWFLSASIRAA